MEFEVVKLELSQPVIDDIVSTFIHGHEHVHICTLQGQIEAVEGKFKMLSVPKEIVIRVQPVQIGLCKFYHLDNRIIKRITNQLRDLNSWISFLVISDLKKMPTIQFRIINSYFPCTSSNIYVLAY